MVFNFDRGEDDLTREDVQRRFLYSVNQGKNLCSDGVIADGQVPYTIHDPHHRLFLVEVVDVGREWCKRFARLQLHCPNKDIYLD